MILFLLRKYVRVVNVLLIVAIAYSLAAMINNVLRDRIESGSGGAAGTHLYKEKYGQVSIPNRSRRYYDSILKTNLFGAGGYAGDTETDYFPEVLEGDLTPKTSLSLELLGTFTAGGGTGASAKRAVAVIKNVENLKIKGYSEGQLVDLVTSEKVEVLKIDDCEVTIRRAEGPERITCGNEFESVFSKAGSGSARNGMSAGKANLQVTGVNEVGEGVYQVERKMFDELLAEPASLITDARVVPSSDGIKIFFRTRSVFHKLGLRNGDTIHRINEVSLTDIQNALSLFNDLKGQSEFTVDFTRRGQKKSNRYTIH